MRRGKVPGLGRTGSTPISVTGGPKYGVDFCDQPSVYRTVIDEALLNELTSRYLDLDGARDRLREQQASALPRAEAALAEAEREVAWLRPASPVSSVAGRTT